MNPKISIITPCFNAEKYIEQTILSIINQGYDNLEYIIIDGGSTDGTVDVIKKYEDKISYWISEPDKGQSEAINKGIKVATGDVFNWINGDDFLLDGTLDLISNQFKNHEINVVCTQTQLLHPGGEITINPITRNTGKLFDLLLDVGLNQQGMYWKMECIRNLNGVNENFQFSMDLDLWKRFLITYGNQKIVSLEIPTSVFRLHEESKTGINFEESKIFFDRENHAAYIHYAKFAGPKYLKNINLLFPEVDENLAKKNAISTLSAEFIKKWLNYLFFKKATTFFYANQYKIAHQLMKNMDRKFISTSDLKNYKSFRRWSFLKKYL